MKEKNSRDSRDGMLLAQEPLSTTSPTVELEGGRGQRSDPSLCVSTWTPPVEMAFRAPCSFFRRRPSPPFPPLLRPRVEWPE